MERLNREQIDKISQDLKFQGLTFDPLREELLDHLICDIEIQMKKGNDFSAAWRSVKEKIPENHFKSIQNETMELLNRKLNPVKILAIISIALLSIATVFKMLHFPGAGFLLLAFMLSTSITLLLGSTRSAYVYRQTKGRNTLILAAIFIVFFTVGLCFKILQLPGATLMAYLSVSGLCVLFISLSIYFYLSIQKSKEHLLIKLLHDERNIPEKTALTLIFFGILFNYSSILFGLENFGGVFFFIFSVILTGLYAYSLSWKYYVQEGNAEGTRILLLVFSSVALIMFMVPAIGSGLSYTARQIFAFGPMFIFCIIACVHYLKFSGSRHKVVLIFLSLLILFYPVFRLGTKFEWFEGLLAGMDTNPVFIMSVLMFLMLLLIIYRKEKLFRALIILTIASHMIPNM
jgi:hypothetical protein